MIFRRYKRMKKLISLLLALTMLFALASCNKTNADETLKVFTLKGPTGIGMSKIMNDCENGTSDIKCDFTIASSPDEITGNIIQGDFDFAAVPSNLAAVLYSKNPDTVRIAAVNVYSVLYILENGNTVNSITDLEGKTLYATGKGSTPEYIISYLLDKYDVNCNVEFLADHSELATKMISGEIALGMLPMPNSTTVLMKNSDFRVALDLGDVWDEAELYEENPSMIMQGCLIVNAELLENDPDTVEKFLDAYAASVTYLHKEPDKAAKMVEKFGIVPSLDIAKNVVKAAGIVFRRDNTGFEYLKNFYNVLYNYNPASVGGNVPDENAYYYMPKAQTSESESADSKSVSE